MAEPDIPEPLREPDRPGPARLAREAPERLEPGGAVPRDGNPDEADQARAEPGETNALPASHAVDRPEDEEGDRDPFDPGRRDPCDPREVRRPARCKRERADDEQHHHRVVVAATAEVQREQRIPAHECRSERGTRGERRCNDRGASTETAATRRNSQAARSGTSPAMRAWSSEPGVNSGP